MSAGEPSRPQRTHINRHGLGPFAPSANLPFPAGANITVVELLTFLPHSTRCADAVYRFVSNGGTRNTFWSIITTMRDLPEVWNANACGTVIYRAMRDAGYKDWTIVTHDLWHAAIKAIWNEGNLNVSQLRTTAQRWGEAAAADVPFKSLAADIRCMPQGHDALDLTRMVRYCVQRPGERWMYPSDYGRLLQRLGGPTSIRKEHYDRAAFKRWEHFAPPPPRQWTRQELERVQEGFDSRGRHTRRPRTRGDPSAATSRSEEVTPVPEHRPDLRTQPPRIRKQNVEIDMTIEEDDEEDGTNEQYESGYVRKPAEYVSPPEDEAVSVNAISLDLAFAKEGVVGERDAFSPYAFAGPRRRQPYRMLHEVGLPDPADTSGWAENLRWALEQRACFWHVAETEAWSESPGHMEFIAQTRIRQVWASDELLAELAEG